MNNYYHLDKAYLRNPLEYEGILVGQIGRLYCKADTVIKEHIHTDLFELTIATDGAGLVTTNGITFPIKKGDIYLSHPCDVHQIKTDPEKLLQFDFFAFKAKEGVFKEEMERIAREYGSPGKRIFRDERIRPLVGNALAELTEEKIHSKELLAAIFRQIMIYVIRGFQKMESREVADNVSHAEILCYKMMNYIDTHIYSMEKLEDLAEVMDYSYGYLSALFKKTTSGTLFDYYRNKRLDAAKLLLLEKKLTVTQISELLNYSSVYAFSKAFHQRFGTSPRKYQNREENGENIIL